LARRFRKVDAAAPSKFLKFKTEKRVVSPAGLPLNAAGLPCVVE